MRWAWVVVMALLAALLQVSLLGSWRVEGAVLNLALVMVLLLAFTRSASEAILVALVAGIVLDATSGGQFGLATSSLVCVGLLAVASRQAGVQTGEWLVRTALLMAATILWGSVHIATAGISQLALIDSWRVLFVEAGMNCAVGLILWRGFTGGRRTL